MVVVFRPSPERLGIGAIMMVPSSATMIFLDGALGQVFSW